MRPYRILVTGSRDTKAEHDAYVQEVLYLAATPALRSGRAVVVIEGRCPKGGVDLAAQRWAEATSGVVSEGHPADWKRRGKSAGPIRNAEMVAAGADICLGFPAPESEGTWDCVIKAAGAGIHIRIYPLVGVR